VIDDGVEDAPRMCRDGEMRGLAGLELAYLGFRNFRLDAE
jgi:hypothetical protein